MNIIYINFFFFKKKLFQLSQEQYFCSWVDYEFYDVLVQRKKAPSKFCFALKSQQKLSKSDPDTYIYYFCVENDDVLNNWSTAFRNAKVSSIFFLS